MPLGQKEPGGRCESSSSVLLASTSGRALQSGPAGRRAGSLFWNARRNTAVDRHSRSPREQAQCLPGTGRLAKGDAFEPGPGDHLRRLGSATASGRRSGRSVARAIRRSIAKLPHGTRGRRSRHRAARRAWSGSMRHCVGRKPTRAPRRPVPCSPADRAPRQLVMPALAASRATFRLRSVHRAVSRWTVRSIDGTADARRRRLHLSPQAARDTGRAVVASVLPDPVALLRQPHGLRESCRLPTLIDVDEGELDACREWQTIATGERCGRWGAAAS